MYTDVCVTWKKNHFLVLQNWDLRCNRIDKTGLYNDILFGSINAIYKESIFEKSMQLIGMTWWLNINITYIQQTYAHNRSILDNLADVPKGKLHILTDMRVYSLYISCYIAGIVSKNPHKFFSLSIRIRDRELGKKIEWLHNRKMM